MIGCIFRCYSLCNICSYYSQVYKYFLNSFYILYRYTIHNYLYSYFTLQITKLMTICVYIPTILSKRYKVLFYHNQKYNSICKKFNNSINNIISIRTYLYRYQISSTCYSYVMINAAIFYFDALSLKYYGHHKSNLNFSARGNCPFRPR